MNSVSHIRYTVVSTSTQIWRNYFGDIKSNCPLWESCMCNCNFNVRMIMYSTYNLEPVKNIKLEFPYLTKLCNSTKNGCSKPWVNCNNPVNQSQWSNWNYCIVSLHFSSTHLVFFCKNVSFRNWKLTVGWLYKTMTQFWMRKKEGNMSEECMCAFYVSNNGTYATHILI